MTGRQVWEPLGTAVPMSTFSAAGKAKYRAKRGTDPPVDNVEYDSSVHQYGFILSPQKGGAIRRSAQIDPSGRFWKLNLPAVALLCTLPLAAQKAQEASPPKYDLHTETKMKGTVEEVKLPPKGSEKEVAHLQVKTGTDTVDVYLCPKSFLDDMGVSFTKGDEVSLTGSKVKQGEADLVLAREVVKGTDTLVLRDDKGNPIWSWHR